VELAHELQIRDHNVILVDYQPTTEMMLVDFAAKINAKIPKTITLHSLRLQETGSSYAEWFASENS
jgi:6-pyruvoyltetrahydropterin/6-carboxytetrahydropterin synthase